MPLLPSLALIDQINIYQFPSMFESVIGSNISTEQEFVPKRSLIVVLTKFDDA